MTAETANDDAHEGDVASLDVLKALGDNTRYAIYLELVRAPSPLATAGLVVFK